VLPLLVVGPLVRPTETMLSDTILWPMTIWRRICPVLSLGFDFATPIAPKTIFIALVVRYSSKFSHRQIIDRPLRIDNPNEHRQTIATLPLGDKGSKTIGTIR
jgi:hypothetical protein